MNDLKFEPKFVVLTECNCVDYFGGIKIVDTLGERTKIRCVHSDDCKNYDYERCRVIEGKSV